jgi:hypothetical protein
LRCLCSDVAHASSRRVCAIGFSVCAHT